MLHPMRYALLLVVLLGACSKKPEAQVEQKKDPDAPLITSNPADGAAAIKAAHRAVDKTNAATQQSTSAVPENPE